MSIVTVAELSPLDVVGTANTNGKKGGKRKNAITCLRNGDLAFDVDKVPLINPMNPKEIVPGYFATVRTDTNEVLGVVESRYNILDHKEMCDLADLIVEQDDWKKFD